MSMENDVTKKIASLEENNDVAGLEEIKNDAEASFDGETVGLAEQAITRLNTKVEEITPPVETTEGQKNQVENMGGSETGLQEVTAPIDEKIAGKDAEIKNVEKDTEQKIGEVKNKVENSNMDFESFSGLTNIQNPANQQKVEEYKNNLHNKFSALDKENYIKVKKLYEEASDEELLKLYDETFPNGAQNLGEPKHNQDQKVQYYRDLSKNLENRNFVSKDGLHAAKLFELKNKGDSSFREEFKKLYDEQSALESNYKKIDSTQKESSQGFNEKTELENLSKELNNSKSAPDFQNKVLQQIFDYSKKHLETLDKLHYTPINVPDYKEDFFKFIATQPKDSFIGKLGEQYKEAYLKTLKKNPNLEKIEKEEQELKSIKSQIHSEIQKLPSHMKSSPQIENLIRERDSLKNSIDALGPKILSEGDSYGVSQEEIDKMFVEKK